MPCDLQVVKPKQEKLAEAMSQLAGVQEALAAKQAQLREVEGQLMQLGEALHAAKTKKEGLQVGELHGGGGECMGGVHE